VAPAAFYWTFAARAKGGQAVLFALGLYGFNSGLMGLALGNFFEVTTVLWLWVPILAVLLSRVLPFPFLAAPFILSFWLVWLLSGAMGLTPQVFPEFQSTDVNLVVATITALGSTLFSGSFAVGILFLTGLAISNWRHAIVALTGAFLAVLVAAYVGTAGEAINSGFISFNAVLAAIAAYAVIAPDLRLSLLAAFFATWIFSVFNRYVPIPALAVDFVLSIWGIMLLEVSNQKLASSASAEGN